MKKLDAVLSGSLSPSALSENDRDGHTSLSTGIETKTMNGELGYKFKNLIWEVLFICLH